MSEQARKKSTFYTVLVVSIVVALAISLFCNLLNFKFTRNVMDREMIETNRISSDIAFNNIQDQFGSMVKAGAMILVNSLDLQKAVLDENANRIRSVTTALSDIADTVPAITSFDIYFPLSSNTVINCTHVGYDVSEAEGRKVFPWFEPYMQQEKRFLLLPDGHSSYLDLSSYLTYVAGLPSYSEYLQVFTAIHIDSRIFSHYINEIDGTFLIFDQDGELIYQTAGRDYAEIAKAEVLKNPDSYSVSSYALDGDDTRLYISLMAASTIPLNFVYIAPSGVSNHFMPYLQSFILNSMLLICINLLIIYLLVLRNNKVYKNRIKSIVPDEGNSNSSFDQISDVLERKFKNINSSYENAQPILIQNTLRMLMLGRSADMDSSKLEELLPYENVRIAIVRNRQNTDSNSLSPILADELENLPRDIVFYMTTIRNETIVVINSTNRSYGFRYLLHENPHIKLFLSGEHKVSAENLKAAYQEVCKILPYGFMYPDNNILSYQDINPASRKSRLSHNEYLLKFDETLKMQRTGDRSVEILFSVVELLVSSDVTIECCRVVTRDLVSILHKNIVNQGIDPVGLLGYDVRAYYGKLHSIYGYEAWMKVCLENYFRYLEELRQTRIENGMKEQIDRILDEAPSNLLSLKYIAMKMDIRTDELSRLFKSCYGLNYSEYIRNRKMEYAKELLAEGLLVKDISRKIGYQAPQYFIKVFKQATGITPNQYSKLMKAKKDEKTP